MKSSIHVLMFLCLMFSIPVYASPNQRSVNNESLIITGLQLSDGVRYHVTLLKPHDLEMQNFLAFISLPPDTEILSVLQNELTPFLQFNESANTLSWNAAAIPANSEALSLGFTTAQALSAPLYAAITWGGTAPASMNVQSLPPILSAQAEQGQISLNPQLDRTRLQAVGQTGVELALENGNPRQTLNLGVRKLSLDFNPPASFGEIWWCSLLELTGVPSETDLMVSVPLRQPLPPGKTLLLFRQEADGTWNPLERAGIVSFDGQSAIYIHDGGVIATGVEEGASPEEAPPAEAAPPPAEEAPPPVEQAPPPAEEAPPPAEEAPPPVEQAPPPVEQAPPPVEQAPPPVEQAPPPAEEVAAAEVEALPTEEVAAAEVEALPTEEALVEALPTEEALVEALPTEEVAAAEVEEVALEETTPENAILDEQGNVVGFNNVSETTDANGNRVVVEQVTDAEGNVLSSVQTTTNPDGSRTRVVEENGQISEISTITNNTFPNGIISERTVRRDPNGNVLDVTTENTAPNGGVSTTVTDPRGNLINQTTVQTDNQGNTRTTVREPNEQGQIVNTAVTQNANGVVTSIKQTTTAADGTETQNTQSFDTDGNLISNQTRIEQRTENNGLRIELLNLDPDGNLLDRVETVLINQPDGVRVQQTSNFDGDGNLIRSRREDFFRNPANGIGFFKTTTTDGQGNIIETTESVTDFNEDGLIETNFTRRNAQGVVIETQEFKNTPDGANIQIISAFREDGSLLRVTTLTTIGGRTSRTVENFPPPSAAAPSPIPPIQTEGIAVILPAGDEALFFPSAEDGPGEVLLSDGQILPAEQGPSGEVVLVQIPLVESPPPVASNLVCEGLRPTTEEVLINLSQQAATIALGAAPQVNIIPPPSTEGQTNLRITLNGASSLLPVTTICGDSEVCIHYVTVNSCMVSVETLGDCGPKGTLVCAPN